MNKNSKKNPRISGEERKQSLIRAATSLFATKGFSATSMNDLAGAVGIRKASLYHHFENKEFLLVAAISHGIEANVTTLEELASSTDLTPEGKIAGALDVIYDCTVKSDVGHLAPLIAETSRLFPDIAKAFHNDFIQPLEDGTRVLLSRGIESGDFAPTDVDALIDMMLAPAVKLAMGRAMFASLKDLNKRFDVETTKAQQLELIVRLLVAH